MFIPSARFFSVYSTKWVDPPINKGSIKLTMEPLEVPRKTLYDKMQKI